MRMQINGRVLTFRGNWLTHGEGIPFVTVVTTAFRVVINDSTLRVDTTNTVAWATTLLLHAGQVCRTFGIYGALWSTVWWDSNVIFKTGTSERFATNLTLSIRTTWGGTA